MVTERAWGQLFDTPAFWRYVIAAAAGAGAVFGADRVRSDPASSMVQASIRALDATVLQHEGRLGRVQADVNEAKRSAAEAVAGQAELKGRLDEIDKALYNGRPR